MGFLDNSGDIILDAVLTDTGRMRLARGDGTFKITKFALADDEINYGLYDKNNASGSAYYDLQILQTPVLEAFTNNASSMKSKLLSISRKDLLYLPMLRLWTNSSYAQFGSGDAATYVVLVDKSTVDQVTSDQNMPDGVQDGNVVGNSEHAIRCDQGLDTSEISNELPLDPDLRETQYLVEMDNRLGQLYTPVGNPGAAATVSFIDDDNIATYYFTENTDTAYVQNLPATQESNIAGPRGTLISGRVGSSMSLKTNTYFFDTLGSAGSTAIGGMDGSTAGQTYKFIDTIVSITGVTTGYRIDVPVRYVKLD
jgi:hypothetical protein